MVKPSNPDTKLAYVFKTRVLNMFCEPRKVSIESEEIHDSVAVVKEEDMLRISRLPSAAKFVQSTARMESLMDLFEVFAINVGIDLSCGDISVTEHFLDGT